MKRVPRFVYRMYPSWWWDRYGDELDALVEDAGPTWATVADLAFAALVVRVQQRPPVVAGAPTIGDLFRRPSGFVPVAMSACALSVIAIHVITSGVAPQADEGSAAHLWQWLMAGQLPFVGWFALRWVPERGRRAIVVSAIQAGAIAAAMFPVWWFKW
jgi:hypothetical protein